jgi:ATP-binding cassette subfamily C protein
MTVTNHVSPLPAKIKNDKLERDQGWLSPTEYTRYMVNSLADVPPLKGSKLLSRLKQLSGIDSLSSNQLLSTISSELSLETLKAGSYRSRDLNLIAPMVFAQIGENYLPLAAFPAELCLDDMPSGTRIFFLNDRLPNRKLSKLQFLQTFLDNRYQRLGLFLFLGSIPVVLVAISELLNQPLFDTIVPSGQVPAVLLIGIATIFFQGSGQIITSISEQSQAIFNSQVDLTSKIATAQRFLNARSQDLPARDIGTWRLTFFAASAFLGSLESLLISIPLALFSLFVNLIVIGAYTDPASIGHLLIICLIPATLSLIISYLSSTIAVKMMGQQSRLESIIYSVVRNIRGIWMSSSEKYFIDRFLAARQEMALSLLRSGTFAASTDILDKITTGLLYAFIYIEYYRSTTTPGAHQASVGSLLVIYSAIGTVSGALNTITGDLVTIFQTLPTYWTPNAIRDISNFTESTASKSKLSLRAIHVEGLTYNAPGIRGPFKLPVDFELSAAGSVAITGPSGSGKSTLLKLLLGYLKPVTGRIALIDSFDNEASINLYQANILVLSQDLGFFGDQLRDVVDPSGTVEEGALEEAINKVGLTPVLDQLPLRWQTPVNEYSRDLSLGQIQLFKLSKAFMKKYDIIISDEPTCHLPEKAHLASIELLNKSCDLHISVLHRSSGLPLFDRVLSLSQDGNVTLTDTCSK